MEEKAVRLSEDERQRIIAGMEKDVQIMNSFEDIEDFEYGVYNKSIIFPIDKMPEVLKNYSIEVADSLQVPVDMVAISTLGIMALCLHGKFYIEPKKDWIEPLNLYVMIIANPSEKKTPTLKEVSSPVNSYVTEVNEKIKPEYDDYMMKKTIITKKINSLADSAAKPKAKVTIQDVIDARRELEDLEEVKLLKLIVDDITPEALVNVMKENNETISLVSAEGGIFGMLSGRYSNHPNMDIFLKAYSGEPYYSDRIGRKSVDLKSPLLSILVLLQPIVIKESLWNKEFRERGLLARFLYAVPLSAVGKRKYSSKPINEGVKKKYNDLVHELLKLNTKNGFTTESNIICLSDGAYKLSEQFFYEIESKILNEYADFEDWAGKYHGQTMRIAGILHCVKHEIKAPNILLEADTMQSAIEIGRYFSKQAAFVFEEFAGSEGERGARYLLEKISHFFESPKLKIPKILKISKRDLYQKCRGRYKTMEELQPGLDELVEHGYIKIVQNKTGDSGRPKDYIYVNPKYIEQRRG